MMENFLTYEPSQMDWESFDPEFVLWNDIEEVPLVQIITHEHIEMFRAEQICGDMEFLHHNVVIDILPSLIEDYNVAY